MDVGVALDYDIMKSHICELTRSRGDSFGICDHFPIRESYSTTVEVAQLWYIVDLFPPGHQLLSAADIASHDS
jgi:hypothetical protein